MVATLSLGNKPQDLEKLYVAMSIHAWGELQIDSAPLPMVTADNIGVGFLVVFKTLEALHAHCGKEMRYVEIFKNAEDADGT